MVNRNEFPPRNIPKSSDPTQLPPPPDKVAEPLSAPPPPQVGNGVASQSTQLPPVGEDPRLKATDLDKKSQETGLKASELTSEEARKAREELAARLQAVIQQAALAPPTSGQEPPAGPSQSNLTPPPRPE